MAKGNPFAGKQAPPFGKGGKGKMKEGSKAEEALDKRQGMPFKKGGKVKK